MSTRCNLLVTKTTAYPPSATGFENPNNGLKTLQFYHHFDGYPTGVGLELATMILRESIGKPSQLASALDVDHVLGKFLPRAYESEELGLHGDIEYVYHLDFDNGIRLWCYKRPGFSTPVPDDDSWKAWPKSLLLHIEDLRERGGPHNDYWNLLSLKIED